jgi:GNAT superfamily N-acetyltransferase
MNLELIETPFDEIKSEIVRNIRSYSEPVDSYFEDHVVESIHYRISLDNVICGYSSVFSKTMMTQFVLHGKELSNAAGIFAEVLLRTGISEIYLPTSDSLLLVMALDHIKEMDVQDLVFRAGIPQSCKRNFRVEKALMEDAGLVLAKHDGFFPSIEEKIVNEELFIGYDDEVVVSFGVIERSKLLENHASIGMVVVKEERGKGYGSMTITKLIDLCTQQGITPVAGCFSKNKYSANALTKAGMCSKTRLLKIKV